jgi:undecaprenyl-diphosphatase
MGGFLASTPVGFIENLSSIEGKFVIFCATTLGTITIVWVLTYLFLRPLEEHGVFAPFEKIWQRIKNMALVCASALGAYVVAFALKNYFRIGRPSLLNFNFHPLLQLHDFGFPSEHAAVFSAIATALFFANRRAGIYAALCALVIGTARILAGVHTPLDILGGYLIGVLIGSLFGFVVSKLGRYSNS